MRAIRGKDMKPELAVRSIAHRMGYRFRLHRKDLPGKPDLTFPSRKAVIFVHGCFWHQHPDASCLDARPPKTNTVYWNAKLERNQARDARNEELLLALGWRILTIWECQTKNADFVRQQLSEFLGPAGQPAISAPPCSLSTNRECEAARGEV